MSTTAEPHAAATAASPAASAPAATPDARADGPARQVRNQAPPLQPVDYFAVDLALQEALEREGGGWAAAAAHEIGALAGSPEARDHGLRAERNEPRLKTHDRYGNRVDEVELDPSWDWLLRNGIERGLAGGPWREPRPAPTSSAPPTSASGPTPTAA